MTGHERDLDAVYFSVTFILGQRRDRADSFRGEEFCKKGFIITRASWLRAISSAYLATARSSNQGWELVAVPTVEETTGASIKLAEA
jgi:hypothetical protein